MAERESQQMKTLHGMQGAYTASQELTVDFKLAVGCDADRVADVAIAHEAGNARDHIQPVGDPPAVWQALVICARECGVPYPG